VGPLEVTGRGTLLAGKECGFGGNAREAIYL
jgi:hypothetical protein